MWKQSDGNCVWPSDSDCPSLVAKNTPSANSGGNKNFLNSPQSVAKVSAELLKENYGTIECPADVTGFFPNPYSCSAYHFCNGGKLLPFFVFI